ncbi:MAG: hypothetical protein QM582_00390 [Micropruina sp.]|uniref:hypothetical protein n=1 Tax=Micropruina sp. TaxID=2737536 RepID=UPI0039E2D3BD
MPTSFDRIQVTRDEQVEHLLTVGARRFPDKRPGRILTELAAERVALLESQTEPFAGFPVLVSPTGTLTDEMVAEALDE